MMERNTATTAGGLKAGDRFYKAGDKNRKVLQMVEGETKKTHFRTYKLFCCDADVIDGNMHGSAKKGYYKPILKDTQVVFLRNVNDGNRI